MDRIIADKVGSQGWYERMPRALPLAGFALAMLVTLAYAYTTERTEILQRQQQARAAASVVGASLGRRVNANTAYLRAAALLLEKQRGVKQAEFIGLSQELSGDDEYRGSEGISWAEAITPQQISAFEGARRAEGMENYTVHPAPAPGARMLTPVTYLGDPTPRRRLSYGYDMYSEIQRRTAIDRAEREKRPIATGPIRLAMDRGRPAWPGFLIYMPIFDKTTGRMRGVLGAPFNAQVFLQSVIELEPVTDFSVSLYDGAVRPDRLMARVGPAQSESGDGQVRMPVMVAHRPMVLVVSPPAAPGLSKVAIITLALGSVVAGLLGGMAWLVARQASEDRASLAWLREQASIRGMLSRELNHRVKNTLANVLSIIALTRRRGSDPTSPALNEFADALEGRIRALSATHDLLIASNWGTTPLREVIEAELAPYARGDTVMLEGPDVELAPNDALSLGLAVHELATNASKYGALSVEGACVCIRWALYGSDRVRVNWEECRGPPVPEQRPRGFGTELIERILAHELGERFELVFAREGVRCEMLLPLRSPAMFKMRAKQGEGADQL